MPGMAEKYRELAPGAYLTLMSMIQAIALENLVSRGQEIGVSYEFGVGSSAVWLAWVLALQMIVATWVTNAQGFMSTPRWHAGASDFLLPFGGGLVQFVAIGWIGESTLPRFMILVGTSALASVIALRWIFSFNEEEMAEFLENLWAPGLYACACTGGVLGLAGGTLLLFGVLSPAVTVAMLVLWVVSGLAMLSIWVRAWLRSVVLNHAA